MPQVLQSFGAFGRIQEYCAYGLEEPTEETVLDASSEISEIQLGEIGTNVSSQSSGSKWPVHVRSATLSWNKDSKPVLHDVDIKFAASRITAVVGAVGSGKSALINSIVGEMFSGEQSTSTPGRCPPIAFCAHEPWLENSTIQRNITGPLALEKDCYSTVKWACNLDEDIVLLPSGDQTQIGAKGYSLSGRQKQRIVSLCLFFLSDFIVLILNRLSLAPCMQELPLLSWMMYLAAWMLELCLKLPPVF